MMKNTRLISALFNFTRNCLAIIGLMAVLAGGYAAVQVAKSYNMPPRLFALKVLKKVNMGNTAIAHWVTPAPLRSIKLILPNLNNPHWSGHGASSNQTLAQFAYSIAGNPIPAAWVAHGAKTLGKPKSDQVVVVDNTKQFLQALRHAHAGDVITLQPGIYSVGNSRRISLGGVGTVMQPIVVRAQVLGTVFIQMDTQEGFFVDKPYWVFENLDIKGVGKSDSYGEHAFHVVGKGRGFVLRNSRVHEFNAMIKGNGVKRGASGTVWPDGALIEGNSFYNTRARQTSNPVTFIDVVGADNWIIRGNLLANFEKAHGDRTSYGAFIKGNSSNGVFENNLVIGEYSTTGGVRVGLSLGGGGTGIRSARKQSIEVEHTAGIVRNNIVMYCSDVGLYLNKARDIKVLNNTFYRTVGIDVRFASSVAVIKNNIVDGRILERDGGNSLASNNLVCGSGWLPKTFSSSFSDWFVAPEAGDFTLKDGTDIKDKAVAVAGIFDDFYGELREKHADIGAIEYGAVRKQYKVLQ